MKVVRIGKEHPLGNCPGCGAELLVTLKPDVSPETIIHLLPICTQFTVMDADSFLRWVLAERSRQRQVGEA